MRVSWSVVSFLDVIRAGLQVGRGGGHMWPMEAPREFAQVVATEITNVPKPKL
jgi:hypothetical protein